MSKISPYAALPLIQENFPGKLRLNVTQLAIILNLNQQTIRNRLSKGTFQIPSYNDCGRFFDIRDVALYIESKRNIACCDKSVYEGHSNE
jgi:hypothetical protein